MKKFNLSGLVTIGVYTVVEAETLEDAIEIAERRGIESANFDESQRDRCWISDEFDGTVHDIREN